MRKSCIAAGFALTLVAPIIGAAPAAASASEESRTYEGTVTSIIDGDSITVAGIDHEVRLIGVDAAEGGECYYRQAKGFAQDELEGAQVELRTDDRDEESDGDRLFAYVYVGGAHFNLESVSQGYARERSYGSDYKLRSEFMAAQRQAAQENRGRWDACS